jgi:hypothetical protein
MLRQSLIAAAVAAVTVAFSASSGFAQTQAGTHERTIVHHVYTYEPAPILYWGPYQAPYYATYYGATAPVAAAAGAAGATACFALSLVGAC